jgi:hypothetical protein
MEPVAKKQKRDKADEILRLELKASESPKHFNNISRLLDLAFPTAKEPQPLAILALSRVFVRLSADGWFRPSKSDQTAAVRQWLADRLQQFTGSLRDQPSQHASLVVPVLMKLAQQQVESGSETWADGLLPKIVEFVTKHAEPRAVFLRGYFAKYVDIQYHTTDLLR